MTRKLRVGDWVKVKNGEAWDDTLRRYAPKPPIVGLVTAIGGQGVLKDYRPDLFQINHEMAERDWGPSPTPETRNLTDVLEIKSEEAQP